MTIGVLDFFSPRDMCSLDSYTKYRQTRADWGQEMEEARESGSAHVGEWCRLDTEVDTGQLGSRLHLGL